MKKGFWGKIDVKDRVRNNCVRSVVVVVIGFIISNGKTRYPDKDTQNKFVSNHVCWTSVDVQLDIDIMRYTQIVLYIYLA